MNETTVTLCGRLVADPENRQTSKGDIATMRIAVNERKPDSIGGFTDGRSSFYPVTVWGETGREVLACLRQGHCVVVHGILRVNRYPSEGRSVERVEVTAYHVGPDLRFGTAVYRSKQRGDRRSDSAAFPADPGAEYLRGRQLGELPVQEEYTGAYEVVEAEGERAGALEGAEADG